MAIDRRQVCYLLLLFLLCSLSLSPGCRKHPARNQGIILGVVLKQNTSPLFIEIEKGIRAAAEEKGVRAVVLSPDGRERRGQEPLVERLISMPVSALLFAPEAETSCIPLVIRAHSLGIPVILIDTDIDRTALRGKEECIECLVACDYEKGGMRAGQFLAKRQGGRGQVAIIEGMPDRSTGKKRKEGFYAALKEFPAINVVDAPPGEFQRTRTYDVFREFLKKNPDLQGIFATNDDMAIGVSDAARIKGRRKLCIIGFNATKEGLEALKEGRIDATINQFPARIGYTAVDAALKALKKEKLSPSMLIAPEVITKETMQMPF